MTPLIDSVNFDRWIIRLTMLSLLVLWGRGHGASLSRLPHSLFSHWLSAWPSLALALSAVETLQYGLRRGRGGPVEPCITCPSDRLPPHQHISLSVSFCLFSHLSASKHMTLIHKPHCAQLDVTHLQASSPFLPLKTRSLLRVTFPLVFFFPSF